VLVDHVNGFSPRDVPPQLPPVLKILPVPFESGPVRARYARDNLLSAAAAFQFSIAACACGSTAPVSSDNPLLHISNFLDFGPSNGPCR